MPRYKLIRHLVWMLIGLFVFTVTGFALAQGNPQPILIGQNVIGELTDDVTTQTFSVISYGGETATVRVLSLTPGFVPRLRIVHPVGVEILNLPNPSGLNTLESILAFYDSGTYSIEVSSEGGSVGEFVLSLAPGAEQPEPTDLILDQPISDTISVTDPLHRYRFSTTSREDPPLILQLEAGGPGVLVTVYNLSTGRTVASTDTGVSALAYRIPPSLELTYWVDVRFSGVLEDAPFTICLGTCGSGLLFGAVIATQEVPPVIETEEALPGVPTCRILSNTNGAVNVRSGPGTQYAIVGNLPVGQALPVFGQLSGGGWVQVSLSNGGTGWVSATVARLEGDCAALPIVTAPANAPLAPTSPPAPTLPPVPTTSSGGSSGGGTAPTTVPTTEPPPPAAPLPDISVQFDPDMTTHDADNLYATWIITVANANINGTHTLRICVDNANCLNTSYSNSVIGSYSGTATYNLAALDATRIAHTVTVTVDVNNAIAESNESNNTVTYNFQL